MVLYGGCDLSLTVSSKDCSFWFLSSGFGFLLSPGSSHSCDNIVLFRPSLPLVNFWCDVDGRFLQCEFSYLDKSFRICCIYCPNCNPARDQFLVGLHPKIDPSVSTFLLGRWIDSVWKSRSYADALNENPINLTFSESLIVIE